MLKIAITGNIASGKSTFQKFVETMGFPVFDTDIECHMLLENNEKVKLAFSNYDILEDGKISRSKLGQIVFSNSELIKKLEQILYPDLIKQMKLFFDKHSNEDVVFVAIPQLFEANMEEFFDKIILIYCDDKIRKQRLILRNNFTEEYAEIRLKSQINQDEKVKKSDYVVNNNYDKEWFQKETNKVISDIITKCK